jgi:hypothetical protein
VKTRVDELFRKESQEFALRFQCEDCAHYDLATERCSNGFPSAAHRVRRLDVVAEIEFCKLFELG